MKNRKPLVTTIAMVLAILMALSVVTGALITIVNAENSSEIKKRLDSLQSEADQIASRGRALQSEINQNEAKTKSTIEQKSQLDQRIEITRQEIENINEQIQQYNLLIAEKQQELDAALAEQAELNEKFKLRIRTMEEDGELSYWSVLFQANSFSDLLDRLNIIKEIASADQLMLALLREKGETISQARATLEQERTAMEAKKGELSTLNEQLDGQRSAADSLIQRLTEELGEMSAKYEQLDAQEAALREKILKQELAYEKALSAEEAARLNESNKNNVAGGNASSGSGFSAPVPAGSAYVTDAYGYRIHPIYGYYGMHHGVDLAAGRGTAVYAIASGSVTSSAYDSINGNCVTISHGGGYASVYAHLDYATVSGGAYVSQGEIIGYVGSTGWASGPHLHFEIHKNGSAVNPMNYISLG